VNKLSGDIRKGFLYKRVPHVTLKSIANNEEIDTIHAKWQPQLDDLRAKFNKAIGESWEEWEDNGESFFVRHAYFTGKAIDGEGPCDKLKRALRAEIEAGWSALYSTQSRPFKRPEKGKIAVKVINHYGDEVLKVYTGARLVLASHSYAASSPAASASYAISNSGAAIRAASVSAVGLSLALPKVTAIATP